MSQSTMAKRPFPTPHDAEQAFYDALERRDLEAMMAVWAVEEEVVCIHPGGPRLTGHEEVMVGWRQIFASGGCQEFCVNGFSFLFKSLAFCRRIEC